MFKKTLILSVVVLLSAAAQADRRGDRGKDRGRDRRGGEPRRSCRAIENSINEQVADINFENKELVQLEIGHEDQQVEVAVSRKTLPILHDVLIDNKNIRSEISQRYKNLHCHTRPNGPNRDLCRLQEQKLKKQNEVIGNYRNKISNAEKALNNNKSAESSYRRAVMEKTGDISGLRSHLVNMKVRLNSCQGVFPSRRQCRNSRTRLFDKLEVVSNTIAEKNALSNELVEYLKESASLADKKVILDAEIAAQQERKEAHNQRMKDLTCHINNGGPNRDLCNRQRGLVRGIKSKIKAHRAELKNDKVNATPNLRQLISQIEQEQGVIDSDLIVLQEELLEAQVTEKMCDQ